MLSTTCGAYNEKIVKSKVFIIFAHLYHNHYMSTTPHSAFIWINYFTMDFAPEIQFHMFMQVDLHTGSYTVNTQLFILISHIHDSYLLTCTGTHVGVYLPWLIL